MKIQVQRLRPGDILQGSGETVISWSAGLRTPSGKVDITLEKNEKRRRSVWGKYTLVSIHERTKVS